MTHFKIRSKRGETIALNVFGAFENRKLLIIAPATGVKQTFYQGFAQYFAASGFTVITFDYYGIGQSLVEPIKDIQTKAEDWGADNLESVIQFAKRNFNATKITLLGLSIGGQLIGLAPSSACANKIILVGAQSGYWRYWNGLDRIKLLCLWYIVFPLSAKIFGYVPSRSFSKMENLPKHVGMQWRDWCVNPDYIYNGVSKEKLFFESIQSSVLSYSIHDDDLAPERAVDWLTALYKNAIIKRRHLSIDAGLKIGHFGFFQAKQLNTIWKPLRDELTA